MMQEVSDGKTSGNKTETTRRDYSWLCLIYIEADAGEDKETGSPHDG